MATPYTLEKPAIKKRILGWIVDGGWSDQKIAQALTTGKRTVSRQAITAFRHRNAAQVLPAIEVAEKQAMDYAIANKVNRIATNDLLKNLLLEVRDARAKGGTGIETGLVVMSEKALGSGDGMTIVEEYEIDPALITLIDRLHHSTANEMGQLPKAATVDLSDRRTYILEVVTSGNGDVPLG